MLVLTRKTNESVMVGEDVEIIIVEARNGRVKLGITAPEDVAVHRREIYDVVKTERMDEDND